MRRILRVLPLTLLALTLVGGVSFADRGRRDTSHRSGGVTVRDHRANTVRHQRQDRARAPRDRRNERIDRRIDRQDRRADRRIHRQDRRADRRVRVQRSRPVFRNNQFYFAGGVTHAYRAPVIRYRYRNYYRRPALVIENYTPVAGYLWMRGSWSWTGYEWQWIPGHYEIDPNYVDTSYDDTYDYDYDYEFGY